MIAFRKVTLWGDGNPARYLGNGGSPIICSEAPVASPHVCRKPPMQAQNSLCRREKKRFLLAYDIVVTMTREICPEGSLHPNLHRVPCAGCDTGGICLSLFDQAKGL